MDSNKNFSNEQRPKKEIYFFTAAGAVFLLTGLYLFTDVDKKILSHWRKTSGIATLTQKQNIVKVKDDKALSWEDAILASALHNEQQVFTGPESKAQITFKSGAILSIKENSLIRLSDTKGKTSINLYSGLMEMDIKKSPVRKDYEIKIGGKTIKAVQQDNAEAQLSASKDEGKLIVTQGSLLLENNGQKIEAKKDEYIKIDSKIAEIKVVPLEFTLNTPRADAIFLTSKTVDVSFSWNSSKKENLGILQVSKKSDFSTTLFSETAKEEAKALAVKLPPGTYFWKVTSKDAGKTEESAIRTFKVISSSGPTLKAPAQGQTFDIVDEKEKTQYLPVNFSWQEMADATSYELELSDSQGNTSILNTSVASYALTNPKAGRYTWKVRALYEDKQSSWSEKSQFYYKLTERVRHLAPADKTELRVSNYNKDQINFSWDFADKSTSFILQISRVQDFSKIILEKTLQNKKHALHLSELDSDGNYYWRVIPYNTKENKRIERLTSFPTFFAISFPKPELIGIDKKGETSFSPRTRHTSLELVWRDYSSIFPKRKSLQYTLQVAKDAAFGNIFINERTEDNSFKWVPQEFGQFFWRVQANIVTENEKSFTTPYSDSKGINIVKPHPLAPPTLPGQIHLQYKQKAPAPKTQTQNREPSSIEEEDFVEYELPVRKDDRDIIKFFVIEIYEDASLTKQLYTLKTESNRISWKAPSPGKYYLRAAYVDDWGQVGEFSKPSEMIIQRITTPLSEIALTYPKHAEIIAFPEDAKEMPIRFSWEKIENAKDYLFQIARSLDFDNDVIYKTTTQEPSIDVDLKKEQIHLQNRVYWKVTSTPESENYTPSSSKRRLLDLRELRPTPERTETIPFIAKKEEKKVHEVKAEEKKQVAQLKKEEKKEEAPDVFVKRPTLWAAGISFQSVKVTVNSDSSDVKYNTNNITGISLEERNFDFGPDKFPLSLGSELRGQKISSSTYAFDLEYALYESLTLRKFSSKYLEPFLSLSFENFNFVSSKDSGETVDVYNIKTLAAGAGLLIHLPIKQKSLDLMVGLHRPVSVSENSPSNTINASGSIFRMQARSRFFKSIFGAADYDRIDLDSSKLKGSRVRFTFGLEYP